MTELESKTLKLETRFRAGEGRQSNRNTLILNVTFQNINYSYLLASSENPNNQAYVEQLSKYCCGV